jgi:hypothetical protein
MTGEITIMGKVLAIVYSWFTFLPQCRRAGLYEQGKAIYEKGGLNLANLLEEEQIEAEDDYRICVRRGSSEEAKPKRQRRKAQDDDE